MVFRGYVMYKLKDAVWHNKDTENEWVEFGYGITADGMNIKLVKLGFNLKTRSLQSRRCS